ncbi:hypothetical protein HMPREF1437_00568 [Helicobacter pylori HP116Bi]|nr:hypothetical protein HMPREF1437_00568 [Helicobacter pylori HP116Bi]
MFFQSSLKAFSFKGFPLNFILNLWGNKEPINKKILTHHL